MKQRVNVGKDFGPSAQLKSYYYFCAVLLFVIVVIPWYLPLIVFVPFVAAIMTVFFVLPVLLAFLFVFYWIPMYYKSVVYRLTDKEMTWRRGVWFRNTGIVPYNRITNVDISQGPISRKFGIGSVKIQTAGYSAASQRSAEIRLDGIEDFEGLRETIMKFVRGKPVAAETYGSEDRLLGEVVKIRKLVEKRRR